MRLTIANLSAKEILLPVKSNQGNVSIEEDGTLDVDTGTFVTGVSIGGHDLDLICLNLTNNSDNAVKLFIEGPGLPSEVQVEAGASHEVHDIHRIEVREVPAADPPVTA